MGTCSDNLDGAGNQQERLIEFHGWIVGFVDGEGCFSIGFVRQPNRPGRVGYKTGWQVVHTFAVTQGASSAAALEELKEFFGVGRMYRNRRHDNHREDLLQYRVGRRDDLLEVVIPFFERHPLRSAKRAEFEEVQRVRPENGVRLSPDGAGPARDRSDRTDHESPKTQA